MALSRRAESPVSQDPRGGVGRGLLFSSPVMRWALVLSLSRFSSVYSPELTNFHSSTVWVRDRLIGWVSGCGALKSRPSRAAISVFFGEEN